MSTNTEALLARRSILGPAYRLFYDEPFAPVRGEDVWLLDAQGKRYLDAYNNVPVVGHCNPHVVRAMAAQAATLCTHTRYLHASVLDYAEQLLHLLPGALNRVMFTCSGSEANDLALRIAQAVTGGTGIVVSRFAYHGVTQLLAQLSPSLAPTAAFVRTVAPPLADGSLPPQDLATRFARDVAQAFGELRAAGIGPAALLVDTTFSSDGLAPPSPGLFDGAFSAARSAGALVIADEVQAGFGRLGPSWWGFAAAQSVPDLVTMGKPMGNGYPVAAVAGKQAWMDTFARHGRYFNTFGGNPVAMAAAQAVLEQLRERALPERAAQTGQWLHAALQELGPLGVVTVRGAGLYWAIQLAPAGAQSAGQRAHAVVNHMRRNGVLISTTGPAGDVLKIRPPLTFSREHAEQLVDSLRAALQA